MGGYITVADLEGRLGAARLAQLCGVEGAARTALLTAVAARAEALVDAHLKSVPSPAVELARDWALDIAEFELHKRGSGAKLPEKVVYSYEDALRQLRDAAAGKLALGQRAAGNSLCVDSNPPLFGGRSMPGY